MEMNEEFIRELDTLIENKNYPSIKKLISELHPTDAAEILSLVEADKRLLIFRLMGKALAAEAFVEMDPEMQVELLKSFNDNELRGILS